MVVYTLLTCLYLASIPTVVAESKYQLPAINISMHSLDTDAITIAWNLSDPDSLVTDWRVTAYDLPHGEYIASYEGLANIDKTNELATVFVHKSDTRYNVCLVGFINETVALELGTYTVQKCDEFKTIPMLRSNSLFPLVAVLGFFVFLVFLGGLSYKIKQFQLSSHRYQKTETAIEHHQNGVNKHNYPVGNHIEA